MSTCEIEGFAKTSGAAVVLSVPNFNEIEYLYRSNQIVIVVESALSTNLPATFEILPRALTVRAS